MSKLSKIMRTVLVASVFLAMNTYANTNLVGNIDHQVNVVNGQLVVDIPISLPKSNFPIQPNIGLQYSSAGGTSYYGYGVSITGLSSIYQCEQKREEVTPSNDIQYCLDGQPIFGSSTNFYSPHKKNQKITRKYIVDSSAYEWSVINSDGYVYTYNRAMGVKNETYVVTSIKSPSYTEENKQIAQFDYGSSPSKNIKLKTATFGDIKVDFNYKAILGESLTYQDTIKDHQRQDVDVATVLFEASQLENIKVSRRIGDGFSEIKTYMPKYKSNHYGIDRLDKLSLCFARGGCVNDLSFRYLESDALDAEMGVGTLVQEKSIFDLPDTRIYASGDINADGLNDFCYYSIEDGGVMCRAYNENSFSMKSSTVEEKFDLSFVKNYSTSSDELKNLKVFNRYEAIIASANSLSLVDLNADGYDD